MRNGPYILVVPPSEYPGKLYRNRYAYEHHVVWWQNTGQVVPKDKIIHHKNENKTDNRFENFELKTQSDHVREHITGTGEPNVELICPACRCMFILKSYYYNQRIKNSQSGRIFCGRSCQISVQQSERWNK